MMMFTLTNLDVNALASRWWVLLVRGIAAILFGVLALVWPGISILALVILWGAYAFVDGVFDFTLAANAGSEGRRWGWLFFEGLVSIGAAVVALVWPGMTAFALLALIAVWAIFTGIAEIVAAIELRRVIEGEWLLALSGVLSVVFGVLVLIYPRAGALAVLAVIGAYAMVFGVLMIGLGIRLHRLLPSGHPSMPRGSHA
jgi:uncharacterized membrane protein HdeD (DUF308 family)